MANEAVCIQAPTIFERRVIANATAVPIGTIMKLGDANTVVVSAADSDPFGGICWVEHTASEGVTELTVAMNGRWSFTTTAAAIPAGNAVSIAGANLVALATEADTIVGSVIGKALNTIGGGGGTVIVEVGQLV
jgi:hypothetical protein